MTKQLAAIPHFSLWIDPLVALLCYAAIVAGMLHWLHKSEQESVDPTPEAAKRIYIRVAIIVFALFAACYVVDIAFWLILVLLFCLAFFGYTGTIYGLLGLPVIALGHLLVEYALGFPNLLLPKPKSTDEAHAVNDQLVEFVGRTAICDSPLRPLGEIEIDGTRRTARSAVGDFVSEGTPVVVTGVQSGTLLVRVSESETSCTAARL